MQHRPATPEDFADTRKPTAWEGVAVPFGTSVVPASEVEARGGREKFSSAARGAGNLRGLSCSVRWKTNGDALLTYRRMSPKRADAVKRFGPYRPSSGENRPRSHL